MPISLGWEPLGLTVTASPGKPCVKAFRLKQEVVPNTVPKTYQDLNWPAGTTAVLAITNTTPPFSGSYSASIAGAVMSWNVAAATADTWPDGAHATITLVYGTGGPSFNWMSGGVVRRW